MANILAVGNTSATSTTFAVTPGAPVTVHLIGSDPYASNHGLTLEAQGSDSNWYRQKFITKDEIVYGAGTYRVSRGSGANIGADSA